MTKYSDKNNSCGEKKKVYFGLQFQRDLGHHGEQDMAAGREKLAAHIETELGKQRGDRK